MEATTQIVKVDPAEYGVDENHAKQVEATFRPMLDKMTSLEDRFNEVVALEIGPETCEQARKLRLEYVKVRTGTATIHKDLKAFFLAAGRFIDGWKNVQIFASQGKEDRLKAIEEHYGRIEQAKIQKLAEDRAALLEPLGVDPMHLNLGMMADDVWSAFFEGTKVRHEQKLEAERKAEEARIKAEEEEKERLRLQAEENARLKAEAEKREAAIAKERKKLEAARKAAEARAKRERAATEKARLAAENKAKAEREAAAAEQRRIQARADAKLKAEREERGRLERELRAKREAEEAAEAERIAAEQAELAMGDEERFDDLVGEITALTTRYEFQSVIYQDAYSRITAKLREVLDEIMQTEELL